LHAYGKPEPGPENLPMATQSTMLEYVKKAISYIMPNCGRQRDEHLKSGNLTRSNLVGSHFSVMQKNKNRKQGWALQARQEMEHSKFE